MNTMALSISAAFGSENKTGIQGGEKIYKHTNQILLAIFMTGKKNSIYLKHIFLFVKCLTKKLRICPSFHLVSCMHHYSSRSCTKLAIASATLTVNCDS